MVATIRDMRVSVGRLTHGLVGVISRAGLVFLATISPLGMPAQADLAPEWRTCFPDSNIDLDQQIKSCTTLINSGRETTHNRSMAYNNRGVAYYSKRDFDRSIGDYTEAIRLDPRNALAYRNRGFAYQSSGQLDRAMSDYNDAIRLDPTDQSSYNSRGTVYEIKDNYDRAIADFNEAIRLNPKFAMAYHNRGYAYVAKKDYDQAIADCNEAIRLDPKYAIAYK